VARFDLKRGRNSKNDAASNLTLPALFFLKQGRSQNSGPYRGPLS